MKDFFETEVKINAEAAVAVGDVAGHKVTLTGDQQKCLFFRFFSVYVAWFSSCISLLVKVVANGRMIFSTFVHIFSAVSLHESHSLLGTLKFW